MNRSGQLNIGKFISTHAIWIRGNITIEKAECYVKIIFKEHI